MNFVFSRFPMLGVCARTTFKRNFSAILSIQKRHMSTTDTATPLPTPQPTTPSSSSQPVNANKSSEWSKSKKSSYAKPLTEYDIFLNKFSLLQYPSSYRLERASDINRIDHYVETLLSQGTRFGLDMEWEPTFNKGARQNKTALIQICSANAILIIQTSKFKKLPRKLEEFLQDRTKYKSGVNIRNDGLKLYRDFGVLTNGLVELTTMAVQSNFERMRLTDRRSLQALTAIFLEKKMLKGPVQLSKWGSSILTDRQIKYAANDAYVSEIGGWSTTHSFLMGHRPPTRYSKSYISSTKLQIHSNKSVQFI
ncbi:ribonuclease H-like domain-containing protein [Spinellus fusiger]|nr:ribonuclease H-like domain-containing protein [Spinellus fusiger]